MTRKVPVLTLRIRRWMLVVLVVTVFAMIAGVALTAGTALKTARAVEAEEQARTDADATEAKARLQALELEEVERKADVEAARRLFCDRINRQAYALVTAANAPGRRVGTPEEEARRDELIRQYLRDATIDCERFVADPSEYLRSEVENGSASTTTTTTP